MKQVVYGILYLVVFLGIVFGVYFLLLKPPASCFDNIQNQGEQGVDCGGPCAAICIPSSIQPISVIGPVRVFSPLAGRAVLLAQLENANSDFAAASFDYVMTLYGADGSSTVAAFSGSSFAYADETKYLVLPNEPLTATVSRADIAVSNVQWVPAPQMGLIPQFAFTNITSAATAKGYMTVQADITNRDISLFHNIVIAAVFKDAARMPIGASQTLLDSLAPGATQHFSISYPLLPNENISATELKAYTNRQ